VAEYAERYSSRAPESTKQRRWSRAKKQASAVTGRVLEGAECERGHANRQMGGGLERPENRGFGVLGGRSATQWAECRSSRVLHWPTTGLELPRGKEKETPEHWRSPGAPDIPSAGLRQARCVEQRKILSYDTKAKHCRSSGRARKQTSKQRSQQDVNQSINQYDWGHE